MILEYCLAKRKFSTKQKRNIKKSRMIKFSVWLGTSLIRKKNNNLYWKIKQEYSKSEENLILIITYYCRGEHITCHKIYSQQ